MTQPTPAIVPQSAVRRLPRLALWLFCAAYVLPGLFGREPWKGNEFTAFSYMLALAEGQSDWLNPNIWGQAPDLDALLPYWLGAWAIQLAPSWLSAGLAVRIPFAMLLGLTMAATWHGVYYLALSPQAQPVPFAFGGEAKPKDYARTIADGSVLALIACLGLSLLSHEASPILMQLAFVSFAFYGVAALPYHPRYSLTALTLGLLGLSLSGAPSFAVLMAVGSGFLCLLDRQSTSARTGQTHALGLLAMGTAVAALATALDVWHWRLIPLHNDWREWRSLLRLLAWFTWPAWPLAIWTLWRWRRQWTSLHWSRHLVLPMWFTGLTVSTAMLTRSAEQTLLLALPSFATLAAFALPNLNIGGIHLLGTVTWQTLEAATLDGLRLAAIIVSIGMANTLANPKRLLKSTPGALYEVATAMTVAINLAPQLIESLQRVRKARNLRGRSKGISALNSIVIPALEDTIEQSLGLAASMDARGFGRRGNLTNGQANASRALSLSGIMLITFGAYFLLATELQAVAITLLALGVSAIALTIRVASRRNLRTRYRRQKPGLRDLVLALTSVAAVALAVVM